MQGGAPCSSTPADTANPWLVHVACVVGGYASRFVYVQEDHQHKALGLLVANYVPFCATVNFTHH